MTIIFIRDVDHIRYWNKLFELFNWSNQFFPRALDIGANCGRYSFCYERYQALISILSKGPVPKTRKFKLYAYSEEFTSDRGSPKEHFNQKMRKKFWPLLGAKSTFFQKMLKIILLLIILVATKIFTNKIDILVKKVPEKCRTFWFSGIQPI